MPVDLCRSLTGCRCYFLATISMCTSYHNPPQPYYGYKTRITDKLARCPFSLPLEPLVSHYIPICHWQNSGGCCGHARNAGVCRRGHHRRTHLCKKHFLNSYYRLVLCTRSLPQPSIYTLNRLHIPLCRGNCSSETRLFATNP